MPYSGKELEAMKKAFRKFNHLLGDDNAVGYNGAVKMPLRKISINVSRELWAEIYLYGEPYKIGEIWYMDVMVGDKDPNLKLAPRKTKNEKILDQMRIDDLVYYLSKYFEDHYKQFGGSNILGDHVNTIILKENAAYRLFKVVSADEKGILFESKSEKKYLKYLEIARALLNFSSSGTAKLQKLLSVGFEVEGLIYKTDSTFNELSPQPGREVFKIEAINASKAANYGAPFSDHGFVKIILDLLKNDELIVFDLNSSEVRGASFSGKYFEKVGILTSRPGILFSEYADRSILTHELKHHQDKISGIEDALVDSLNNYFDKTCVNCTKADIIIAYKAIIEQRAYATQFNTINKDVHYTPIKINTYFGDQDITKEKFVLTMTTKEKNIFEELYAQPFKSLIKRLQDQGVNTDQLIEIVKTYLVESEIFVLSVAQP
jgi:hypothetical protein